MQIIKFRSDFRSKLFNKMMRIAFSLNKDDNLLKIRVEIFKNRQSTVQLTVA